MTVENIILPLIMYGGVVVLLIFGIAALSSILGERHQERATGEPYESGIAPTGSSRIRFSAHYYVIAILFVIFDLETVFLVAWSVSVREVGRPGFIGAGVFVAILLTSLVYEWRIGALKLTPSGKKIIRIKKQKSGRE